MATVLYDRVKEICSVTGTGDITLSGALDGSTQEYADRYADGEVVPYCVVESAIDWEVGEGVFTLAGPLIARTSAGVISSSNADGLVVFGAGDKECFAAMSAQNISKITSQAQVNADNITLLHFYRAIDNGTSVQQMVDGFVDEFQDETGVVVTPVAVYDAAGNFYENERTVGDITLDFAYETDTSIIADEGAATDVFFNPTGTKMYVIGSQSTGIVQYTLGTPWVIGSKSLDGEANSMGYSNPTGMDFFSDGLTVTICDASNVKQFTLAVAWDITSTLTDLGSTAYTATIAGVCFSADQTKMYVTTNSVLRQYTLTVAGDPSGGSTLDTSFSYVDQTVCRGARFSPDGLTLFITGQNPDTVNQYSFASAWDLTSASVHQAEKPVTDQEIYHEGLFLKPDGTRLYTVGPWNSKIYQYSLPAPWKLSAVVTSSYGVSGTLANNVTFNPDGLIMYFVNRTSKRVDQYSVPTAYDVSSGITLTGSFSHNGYQTDPRGLAFKADGSMLYLLGRAGDTLQQFALATPWDVTSGVSFQALYDYTAVSVDMAGLMFKPDGSGFYSIDQNLGLVRQFSLATPWQVGNILGAAKNTGTLCRDVTFSSDGSKMYVSSTGSDIITQYDLPTPWDTVTGVTSDGTFSVASKQTHPIGITFSADGLSLYVVGPSPISIVSYKLTVAWDITSGASFVSEYSLSGTLTTPGGIEFNTTGTKVYVLDSSESDITQLTLDPPWQTGNGVKGSTSIVTNPRGVALSADGFKLYAIDTTSDAVTQYTLTTAWDVTGGKSTDGTKSVSGQNGHPTDLFFSSDGTKMYVCGQSGVDVNQYTLTTAWDVTGTVTPNGSYDPSGQVAGLNSVNLSSDGTNMYLADDAGVISQYAITTAWDITGTVTYSGGENVSAQAGGVLGLFFSSDGFSMFVARTSNVHRYTLTTAWDVTGVVTYEGVLSVSLHQTNIFGMFFKSDGLSMYLADYTANYVKQYDLMVAWVPEHQHTVDGVMSVAGGAEGLNISADGSHVYTATTDTVHHYSLTTPWDVTGGNAYEGLFDTDPAGDGNLYGVFLAPDNLTLYTQHASVVNTFDLTVAHEPEAAPVLQGSLDLSAQIAVPASLFMNASGTKMYIGDGSPEEVSQYELTVAWDVLSTVNSLGSLLLAPVTDSEDVTGVFLTPAEDVMVVCSLYKVFSMDLATPYSGVSISSVLQTALSQPDDAHVVLLQEDIDPISLDEDLTVKVSRDGGSTFTLGGTLELATTLAEGPKVLTADVDLSAQPAGTSMQYLVESTIKRMKLHGISLQWR